MTTPEVDTAAALDAKTCDVCGLVLEGPARGRGSATWQLSQHRWNVHKIKSASPRRGKGAKKVAMPTGVEIPERTAATLLKSTAEAVGGGSAPPTAAQLTKGLARFATLGTMFGATWMAESDPFYDGPGMQDASDQLVADLTISEDDAAKLLHPVGRVLAPTGINRKFGRAVIDNVDLADTLYIAMELSLTWRRAARDRREHMRAMRAQLASVTPLPVAGPVPPPAPADTMPGTVPPPTPAPVDTAPGAMPRTGRVIGYEEAQAMRRNGGA